jgi:hypothetical protein
MADKVITVTLDPGERLVVNGYLGEYEATALYQISWDIEEGWATSTCNEVSDDGGRNCLVNNWELPND